MQRSTPFKGTSFTDPSFWEGYAKLSSDDRVAASEAYELWLENTSHPGLQYKKVHAREEVWSVRVSLNLRALGIKSGQDIIWFWIGNHDEYLAILKRF